MMWFDFWSSLVFVVRSWGYIRAFFSPEQSEQSAVDLIIMVSRCLLCMFLALWGALLMLWVSVAVVGCPVAVDSVQGPSEGGFWRFFGCAS